jgi:phosphoenolpyruvate carboxykinase (GTP)
MSDYFGHWLDLGKKLQASGSALPRIYCVNWFRKGADGRFVWPGYGDNMRVLQWIVERVRGHARGEEHVMGVTPGYADLNWSGMSFTPAQYQQVCAVDSAAWRHEVRLHGEWFEQLAFHLPHELTETKRAIERRLSA